MTIEKLVEMKKKIIENAFLQNSIDKIGILIYSMIRKSEQKAKKGV